MNLPKKYGHLNTLPQNKYGVWVKNIIVATLVTLVLYLVSIYISHGTVFIPLDYTVWIELILSICYFLLLFWLYPKISRLIHSNPFQSLNRLFTNFVEGFIVVLATVFLTVAIKLPFLWVIVVWVEEVEWYPDAVRRGFVIHAISGLFFYYFVERNRIRKQLQQERLNAARLERGKFHAELQKLKEQVNPHFLFDNLEVLAPLIKKDKEESVKFVENLSEVYRSFLASDEKELVSLQEELQTLEAYISLLRTQFSDAIEVKLNITKLGNSLSLPAGILFSLSNQLIKMKVPSTKLKMEFTTEGDILKISCGRSCKKDSSHPVEIEQISNRYSIFTNKKPEIFSIENQVIIQLPLLKIENNESSNY
ncbi:sensor histidine kinase [Salegentibacter sp. F14]